VTGIPSRISDLKPGFFEDALRAAAVLGGARVQDASCRPIVEGRGFVGQTLRCSITYERMGSGPEPPSSVIVKMPAGDPGNRRLFGQFDLYRREVGFYQDLQASTPVPTPACYGSWYDPGSGDFLLLLEDLSPAQPADRIEGLPLSQAEQAVGAAARMHAHWWLDPALPNLDWLPAPTTQHLEVPLPALYRKLWPAFEKRLDSNFPRSVRELGRHLKTSLPQVMDRLASPPWTLVHGDYQAGNIFYSPGSIAGVIDWQVVMRGRGAADIAHLLVRSLSPDDRRRWEPELLGHYHHRLCDGGVEDYGLDDCRLDYQLALICEFGLGLVLESMLPVGGEPATSVQSGGETDLQSLARVGSMRFFAALVDLDWPAALAAMHPRPRRGRVRRILGGR